MFLVFQDKKAKDGKNGRDGKDKDGKDGRGDRKEKAGAKNATGMARVLKSTKWQSSMSNCLGIEYYSVSFEDLVTFTNWLWSQIGIITIGYNLCYLVQFVEVPLGTSNNFWGRKGRSNALQLDWLRTPAVSILWSEVWTHFFTFRGFLAPCFFSGCCQLSGFLKHQRCHDSVEKNPG